MGPEGEDADIQTKENVSVYLWGTTTLLLEFTFRGNSFKNVFLGTFWWPCEHEVGVSWDQVRHKSNWDAWAHLPLLMLGQDNRQIDFSVSATLVSAQCLYPANTNSRQHQLFLLLSNVECRVFLAGSLFFQVESEVNLLSRDKINHDASWSFIYSFT